MHAVYISRFGGPDVLEARESSDPIPQRGEALLAVEASGVGYVDVMAREGRYSRLLEPGIVPGLEVAGRVIAVGPDGDQIWIGRRVFALPMDGGGYSDRIVLKTEQLMQIPDQLSYVDAVGLGMNALVAKVGIDRAGLRAGEKVFVRGAGGGIGLMAVQLAAAAGAEVMATTSSEERANYLRSIGAQHILNRNIGDEMPDSDQDLIVDTIAGEDLGRYIRLLNNNGRYVMCGGLAGAPNPDFGMDLLSIFHRSPSFFAFSLNAVDPRELAITGQKMFDDAVLNRIKPLIYRELPLSKAAAAHRAQEDGSAFGKIVLVP